MASRPVVVDYRQPPIRGAATFAASRCIFDRGCATGRKVLREYLQSIRTRVVVAGKTQAGRSSAARRGGARSTRNRKQAPVRQGGSQETQASRGGASPTGRTQAGRSPAARRG